jgi:hypothetical protein
MSALSQIYSGGRIKSIQRGVSSGNNAVSVTISPVDTSKAVVSFLGGNTNSTNLYGLPYITLTSATVLTVTGGSVGGTSPASWQIVEYY